MGKNIGTSFAGTYNACPPPEVLGFGFKSIKRGIKKVGKKAGGVAKKAGSAAKKTAKVSVRVAAKPVKVVAKAGKFAMMALAKAAAKPIVIVFKRLAGRRAAYLAYKARRTTKATPAEKRLAAAWAIGKVRKAGPIGRLGVKILEFVGAHKTAGVELGRWEDDASQTGLTGVEITAAATTVVASIASIMKALNKPGEAPANPAAAAKAPEPVAETQPTEQMEDGSQEAPAEEASEEADTAGASFISRAMRKKLATKQRRGGKIADDVLALLNQ